MQLQSGTLLQGGKYKIERVLGQGGFGITYLAKQELFDRHVCIKEFFFKDYCERGSQGEVTSCTTNSKELVDRFLNKFIKEARTISRLDHPNIVRILDIFQENGTAYYAMEYIEGCSLADKVNAQGALSEAVAVDYIKQAADALDYIHQRSINHLDVKPANIMVRRSDNKAILIDFGLSKQYDEQGGQTSTTPVGISHGYAPMEQYNQGGVSTFSPQSDIYALGATLYKLVTGSTPPQAIEVFNEGLTGLPQSLSPNLVAAIKKTMQPKKGDRPQGISEFRALLGGQYAASVSSATAQNTDDESTRIIGTTSSEPVKKPSSPQPTVAKVEEGEEKQGLSFLKFVIGLVITFIIVILLFGTNFLFGTSKSREVADLTPQELYDSAMEYWYKSDFVNAGPLFEMAVEGGHVESKAFLGACYVRTNVDVTKGLNILIDLAKQENVDAQLQLGAIYKYGINVEKNEEEAFYWWNKAAEQGGAFSQYCVAMCYYNGEGVAKDIFKAKDLFEKSAAQGYEEAIKALEIFNVSKITSSTNINSKNLTYVDLGLPSGTLWADRNVGASTPSEYGGLYRWGNPQTDINGTNVKVSSKNNIIGTEDDVVMKINGNKWRMPTAEQFKELLEYCQVNYEKVYGRNVAKFIGPNGNFIILPLAGTMYNYGRSQAGDFGVYDSGELRADGKSPISLSIFDEKGKLDVKIADFFGKNGGNPVRGVYCYTVRDLQK